MSNDLMLVSKAKLESLQEVLDPHKTAVAWNLMCDLLASPTTLKTEVGMLSKISLPVPVDLLHRVTANGISVEDYNKRWSAVDELRALIASTSSPLQRDRAIRTHLVAMCGLWPEDMSDDGTGRVGFAPATAKVVMDARNALLAPCQAVSDPQLEFTYEHPGNGQRYVVCVTQGDVAERMDDVLFERLCKHLCECEPVGETNVVECSCDEFAEEFVQVDPPSPRAGPQQLPASAPVSFTPDDKGAM